jgi:deoxyribodipyrimidine photolyase-related protein
VIIIPNQQFLSTQYNPLAGAAPHTRTVMEPFYRAMRQHFDVLMNGDAPCGGTWNLDAQNRKPLRKGVYVPPDERVAPDEMTSAVCAEVATWAHVIGDGTDFAWGVTHADAEQVLARFISERLPWFGDYEDAMSQTQRQLFHSTLSPYLNVGLLEPLPVIRAAEAAYRAGLAPLNAVEGFIRQILGWREYMYQAYWRAMPDLMHANAWHAHRPLPAWFWPGTTSGMHCMDTVIARVWQHGYTHHIERLMLISNFCVLAGIDPVAVNHWFLAGYIDAYDWVMWPNVSGMGLNADGGKIATKPYIASATYINKMGDFCAGCRYNPRQRVGADACPFNLLYWNFLLTHETVLRANPRMGPAVLGLRHLADAERATIRHEATIWLAQSQ